eukprot:scaffold9553_cov114-Isochrysis_galbana.AAC.15
MQAACTPIVLLTTRLFTLRPRLELLLTQVLRTCRQALLMPRVRARSHAGINRMPALSRAVV